jgi:glycosyltransferase involved in cell wall biosynthesis
VQVISTIVSIGLPVFNGDNFLEVAIESILAQTYPNFELIISDNGSTDLTPQICKSFALQDKRVKYHRYDENRGASWNFNNVFRLSSGSYFKWASHDDLLMPEFLEECLKVLENDDEVSLAFSRAEVVDVHGQKVRDYEHHLPAFISDDPLERYQAAVYGEHHFLSIFGLMRTETLSKTDLIGGYASSDVVLLGQLSLVGKIATVDKPLFQWRSHSEQSMEKVFKGNNRAYTYWFNPARKGKLNFPHWRLLYEYLTSILFSKLSLMQKVKGLIMILRSRTRISGRRQYLLDIVHAFKGYKSR